MTTAIATENTYSGFQVRKNTRTDEQVTGGPNGGFHVALFLAAARGSVDTVIVDRDMVVDMLSSSVANGMGDADRGLLKQAFSTITAMEISAAPPQQATAAAVTPARTAVSQVPALV